MAVLLINSGKIGIHRFTFNELVELENQGIGFFLCLTQLNKGPWMPKKDWYTFRANFFKAIWGFIIVLLFKPLVLFKSLRLALRESSLAYLYYSFKFLTSI
jgi:hypothetical protein